MSLFSTILAKLGFAKEAIAQTLTQPAAEAAATACARCSDSASLDSTVPTRSVWPMTTTSPPERSAARDRMSASAVVDSGVSAEPPGMKNSVKRCSAAGCTDSSWP